MKIWNIQNNKTTKFIISKINFKYKILYKFYRFSSLFFWTCHDNDIAIN